MAENSIQLLVSVRNAAEALIAADAGVDIIDVKEPDAGALGFAGMEAISEVVHAVDQRVPVSAALGECVDWQSQLATRQANHASFVGLQFLKLGLAGLTAVEVPARTAVAEHYAAPAPAPAPAPIPIPDADWVTEWCRVRRTFGSGTGHAADSKHSTTVPEWVAVAYADAERAVAPHVWQVLEAATDTGCSTLLIDTFRKDGSGTLNWLSHDELVELRMECGRRCLRFVLAGQLTEEHLPAVQKIRPDVFAVRGAVCDGQNRKAAVSAEKVRQLKQKLNNA